MITRNFEITLRIPEANHIPNCFQVTQNDKDVYNLKVHITDGIDEIDYGQVSSATITFSKGDGNVVQGDMAVGADSLTYTMGTNEIAHPGPVLASVQLFGAGGERLTSARFKFDVVKDLITEDAVKSTSEFAILQQLKQELEDIDVVELTNQFNAHKAESVQQSPHGIGSIAGQDYEEGVFTPKIEGLTVAGSHTYYNQIGRYVRIGNRVFLYIDAYINSFDTSMDGQVVISGLPYPIPLGKTENVAVGSYRNIKFAQDYHQLACEITGLSTRLTLIQHGINNNRRSVVAGDLSSASWIRVQFSYDLQ